MILFMDDDPARAVLAYNRMKPEDRSKTIWCMTAKEAIITLQDYKDSLTAVMLDHDLEGESFVNSKREDCGMEVVRFLEKMNKNNDLGSLSDNRFLNGGDITCQSQEGFVLIYRPSVKKWSCPGKNI